MYVTIVGQFGLVCTGVYCTAPNAPSIKILDLSSQCFLSVPESVSKMIRLQELDLSGNSLSTLPESLSALVNLENLDISDNPIQELPPIVMGLPKLKKLIVPFFYKRVDGELRSFISDEDLLKLTELGVEIRDNDVPPILLGITWYGNTPVAAALDNNKVEWAKKLLKHGSDPNGWLMMLTGWHTRLVATTPLLWAIKKINPTLLICFLLPQNCGI